MKTFIDTNLIVYANDSRDPVKQGRAIELIASFLHNREGVISTQVLGEYAVVAINKLKQNMDVVMRQLLVLEKLHVVQITPPLIRRSVELQRLHQVHFWDAGILAAAEQAGCAAIFSEDLNPGQLYSTVRVMNPFAA